MFDPVTLTYILFVILDSLDSKGKVLEAHRYRPQVQCELHRRQNLKNLARFLWRGDICGLIGAQKSQITITVTITTYKSLN